MYRRGHVWWTCVTVGGRKVRRSLRTDDRFLAQQKEAALLRSCALRDLGIETYAETKAEPVAALVDEYVREMTRLGRDLRHVRQTAAKLRRLLGRAASLRDMTPEAIRRALAKIGERTSPRTSNFYRGALSAFYGWLVREGRWGDNPVKRVAPAKVVEARRVRRSLSAAERDSLLASAPPRRSLVYRLAVTTGLRRSEIRSLRWADVDLDQGTVTVRAKGAKNGRESTLPLVAGTVAAFRALGGAGTASAPAVPTVPNMGTFRRDLEAAGIRYESPEGIADFHALRVTFNTLMARAGVSLAQRQALMRHSDPKLTAGVYTRLEAADAIAAIARIDPGTVSTVYPTPRISVHPDASRGSQEPRAGTA